MADVNDIVGRRVNRVVVLKHVSKGKYHRYLCRCDCGKEFVTLRQNLRPGGARQQVSCGCKSEEYRAKLSARSLKHGMSKSRLHGRWSSMLSRCRNPKNPKYARYGGRGIEVCERWMKFENFLADMGNPPNACMTIDRIDVNGNYEPANCRWADQRCQQNNRRDNLRITHDGKTMTAAEWGRVLGISSKVIRQRILRDGMAPTEALTRPLRIHKKERGRISIKEIQGKRDA